LPISPVPGQEAGQHKAEQYGPARGHGFIDDYSSKYHELLALASIMGVLTVFFLLLIVYLTSTVLNASLLL
jgi:hypothetical protein